MPSINKTLMIKSQPLNLGVFANTGEKTLSFAFENPSINPSNNRSEIIGGGFPGLAFNIETYYFNIPEIQGISLKGISKENFNIGLFNVFTLQDSRANFNAYYKNPNWETKLDLAILQSEVAKKFNIFSYLFFTNWNTQTIDLIADLSTIPQSLQNQDITLECLFTVSCFENLGF